MKAFVTTAILLSSTRRMTERSGSFPPATNRSVCHRRCPAASTGLFTLKLMKCASGMLAAMAMLFAAPALSAQAPSDIAVVVNKVFGPAMTANHVPGAVMAVMRDGRVVDVQAFGVVDASGTPTSANTRFAIGSLTKQFTAAAILMLASEEKLSLDDRLARFFPKLPNANLITLRMLLNQTSGLHNYPLTTEHAWPLFGSIDPSRLFAFFEEDRPDFAPGTKWEYSNTNYAVLAGIVAQVSHVPYGEFLQGHIFGPLHMTSTGYGYAVQHGVAQATWQGQWVPATEQLSLDLYYGAGGIVSTAGDLMRWDAALMSGTLLDADAMRAFWSAGHLNDGSPTTYAMGFVPSSVDGHADVWHNGLAPFTGGYCYNAIFPDDRIAVVVLTNAGDPTLDAPVSDVARAVFESYVPVTAEPGEDPAVTAMVRSLLAQLRSGIVDRSNLTGAFNNALTAAFLASTVRPFYEKLGDVVSLTFTSSGPVRHSTIYHYHAIFAGGSAHDLEICVYQGKVCGFLVTR